MHRVAILSLFAALLLQGCETDDTLPSGPGPVPATYTVRGHIGGTGLNLGGITVRLGSRTAETTPEGAYMFAQVAPGDYWLIPARDGYVFEPPRIQVRVLDSNVALDTIIARIFQLDTATIPAGRFTMGSPPNGNNRYIENESPQHQVTVDSFLLGRYEITQQQWEAIMGTNPSVYRGNTRPVDNITWYEAVEFCNRLSIAHGLAPAYTINGAEVTWDTSSAGFRLPTEAEWEYACRAGTTSDRYSGPSRSWIEDCSVEEPELGVIAWFLCTTNGAGTMDIGGKQGNPFGLFDMQGNVAEWCWDWHDPYPGTAQTNPRGPSTPGSNSKKIVRGGSFDDPPPRVRSSYRGEYYPMLKFSGVGVRVARRML